MIQFVLGVPLVAAGVWLLARLLRLLLQAAGVPLEGLWERWQIGRRVDRARRADVMLADGRRDVALMLLETSFYLEPTGTLQAASQVANHHTGVLSRVLSITNEQRNGTLRLLSLAKTDRLLGERRELQRQFIAARQSPGRERRRTLAGQLATNRRELRGAVAQLFREVRELRPPPTSH